MKTYQTWEAIKMLTENPQLKFECKGEFALKQLFVRQEYIQLKSELFDVSVVECAGNLKVNEEWILVQQPVSFMEAIRTFREGKIIHCKLDKYTYTFHTGFMELKDVDGNAITPREIVDGKWFIGEGGNIED